MRDELARLHRRCATGFDGHLLITDGVFARMLSASARPLHDKLVLPHEFWNLRDATLRDLLLLRLAIGEGDITCLAGAGDGELRHWLLLLETHHRHLLKDLRCGGFFLAHQLPDTLREPLISALRAQPERARALAHARANGGALRIADLWPCLSLWLTPGGRHVEAIIRDQLPAHTQVIERVFESDPLRLAVTLPSEQATCTPLVDVHFYEFAERRAWDAGARSTCTTQQLREGVDYYLIISGEYGLYRYFTGDVLTVTGWHLDLPTFRFLCKPPAARLTLAAEEMTLSHLTPRPRLAQAT